jgi:Na+-transporting NADH:ubiquinone oxidoreductase subunit B
MNPVKRLFDSQRRHFEKGGRWERYFFLFENIESVFFAAPAVTAASPHVRDGLDVKRFMFLVIVALLPHYAFGTYNLGYQSHLASGLPLEFTSVFLSGLRVVLPMVAVTYAVGYFWEALFATVRRHEISEGLFVTCALFPLTLPPTQPLWQVALGISFGVVIGKEIFGGTGRNFLNPALTGRAFLYFAYPAQTSGDAVWTVLAAGRTAPVDAFTGATPLAIAQATEAGTISQAWADAGYSLGQLFFGLYPDSIGASATFLCIIGALFLITVGVADYRIICGDILGFLATGTLLNLIASPSASPYLGLNPFYHLLVGGAAFGIAYMTTDPVSAPAMPNARWIYGFSIGMLTVLIRVFNPAFPEGIGLAILFMNCFAPLLDEIQVRTRLKKRMPNVR